MPRHGREQHAQQHQRHDRQRRMAAAQQRGSVGLHRIRAVQAHILQQLFHRLAGSMRQQQTRLEAACLHTRGTQRTADANV